MISICVGQHMISAPGKLGLAQSWFPRVVAERMVVSTRDGVVERAPDPIVFIDAEMSWTNSTGTLQHARMNVHRASRQLITSNPNTLALDDGCVWDVGVNPNAPAPTPNRSGNGLRLKMTRSYQNDLQFARMFTDLDDWSSLEDIGKVYPGETVHFRYRCVFSTPGEWRTALQPRHEAYARWVRLRLLASPMSESGI